MSLPITIIRALLMLVLAGSAVIGFSMAQPSGSIALGLLAALAIVTIVVVPARLLIAAFGWDRMASALPMPIDDVGRWRPTAATIALRYPWLCMNNILLWQEDEQGLRLKLLHPFGLAAPAIFIPWNRIDQIRPLRGPWGAYELIAHPADPLPVRLYVLREAVEAERIRRAEAGQ